MKKLIILSDYGLDDAVAGAYLFDKKELFEKIYVVAVAGNVSADVSLENASKLLCAANADREFITLVRTQETHQAFAVLPQVHGGDGMGDLINEVGDYPYISYGDFTASLAGTGQDYTVLSLGPLTVTQKLMELIPKARLVIMAGVSKEKPNFNGMEFNQALDAKAFSACAEKYPHAMATLDPCRAAAFNLALCKLPEDKLIKRLINRAVSLATARHGDNAFIYDFIASLYLTHPQIFSVEKTKSICGDGIFQLKLTDRSFSLKKFVEKL